MSWCRKQDSKLAVTTKFEWWRFDLATAWKWFARPSTLSETLRLPTYQELTLLIKQETPFDFNLEQAAAALF